MIVVAAGFIRGIQPPNLRLLPFVAGCNPRIKACRAEGPVDVVATNFNPLKSWEGIQCSSPNEFGKQAHQLPIPNLEEVQCSSPPMKLGETGPPAASAPNLEEVQSHDHPFNPSRVRALGAGSSFQPPISLEVMNIPSLQDFYLACIILNLMTWALKENTELNHA